MINKSEILNSLKIVKKRGPYTKPRNLCNEKQQVVKNILLLLKNYERGDIQKISEKTGYSERTLHNWRKALENNPNYSPLKCQVRPSRRVFSDKEEDSMAEYIIKEILLQGIIFTDYDFAELAMDAFLMKYYGKDDDLLNFTASKGFIYEFKKRHGFTTKRCHTKRRPENGKYNKTFETRIKDLFKNENHKYIINIDETGWEIIPSHLDAWHLKGGDHVVRYFNVNDKEKITVVAGISATGEKMPLQFIAKGITQNVLDTQIGDVGPIHSRSYSESGWTTEKTFIDYLICVKNYFGFDDKNRIFMILDVFKVHLTDAVKKVANELNIELIFIPAGMTDILQPLDRKIFGILKAYLRNIFRVNMMPNGTVTKKDACAALVRIWEKLSKDTIEESFEHLKNNGEWNMEEPSSFNMVRHTCSYYRANKEERKKMLSTN